jgi:hypothetical protein
MKCLIAKGDVDAEIDSAPAQADWEGVLHLYVCGDLPD